MAQLNIKDDETHALANELAQRRGTSAARAVKAALREVLAAEPKPVSVTRSQAEIEAQVDEVMRIVRGASKHWPQDKTSKELMDSLYDDDGLPV